MLVVISLTQPVIDISYPPFIGVNWTFIGLASYLYSLGFYFSATSIAQDTNLRQSIRQQFAVIKESGLLDNIGTAQMEQEIRRRVLKIAKEQQEVLEEQTEIQQQPFSEEDIKQYLDEVLEEAKKSTTSKSNITLIECISASVFVYNKSKLYRKHFFSLIKIR